MLDTIVLLTGPVERPVLTLVLQGHNPRLSVQAVATSVELAALRPRSLRSARLIAFWTDTLVPAAVLHRLAFGAYNFHPGPRFPGWGAAHFAVHRGATEFGATAHVMVDKVDAGAIVGVERFWIPRGSTALQLEEMAYAGAARLFWRLTRPLANEPEALPIRENMRRYAPPFAPGFEPGLGACPPSRLSARRRASAT